MTSKVEQFPCQAVSKRPYARKSFKPKDPTTLWRRVQRALGSEST